MNDDLSARLRDRACPAGEPWTGDSPAADHGHTDCWLYHQAADEIERLKAELNSLKVINGAVRSERDDWERYSDEWEAKFLGLQAAIDKVRALHVKTAEEMLDHKCADGDCEHEDECPSILVDVCGCCAGIAQQVSDEYWPAAMDEITWPCPTYVALTQGGEGS